MEQQDSHSEQRKHIRVRVNTTLHMVLVDAQANGLLSGMDRIQLRCGTIDDLSAGGLRITTKDIKPQMEFHLLSGAVVIALKFSLPGQNEPISATAKVVRVKKIPRDTGLFYGLGMTFTEINPNDRTKIESFVHERLNKHDK